MSHNIVNTVLIAMILFIFDRFNRIKKILKIILQYLKVIRILLFDIRILPTIASYWKNVFLHFSSYWHTGLVGH